MRDCSIVLSYYGTLCRSGKVNLRMRNWSSSLLRVLVLITGSLVALQAAHIVSISIAFHALTQDFRNTRSIAGIVVGIGVSMLAAVPGRKGGAIERKRIIPTYMIDRAKLWRNAHHLRLIADSVTRHSDIR